MSQAGSLPIRSNNEQSKKVLRSFGDLHLDFWKLVGKNPLVFIIFPTLIFLPTDLIIALVTKDMETLEAIRMSTRIQQVSSLVFGTFAASTMIWTVKAMVDGGQPSFGASLRGGQINWGAISRTTFQIAWRVGIATILLIVPGIVLAVRYSLALPLTVFEDIHGKPAIVRSKELGSGWQWPMFLAFFISIMIYLPLVFCLLFYLGHLADQAGLGIWAEVVSSVPINIAFALMTMGAAFLFLEIKHPERLQAIIQPTKSNQGVPLQAAPMHAGTTGKSFFRSMFPTLLAIVSWVGAGTFLVSYLGLGFFHVVVGNYYAEKGDLDTSRGYFESAVALEPENTDYLFTLGSQFPATKNQRRKYLGG